MSAQGRFIDKMGNLGYGNRGRGEESVLIRSHDQNVFLSLKGPDDFNLTSKENELEDVDSQPAQLSNANPDAKNSTITCSSHDCNAEGGAFVMAATL